MKFISKGHWFKAGTEALLIDFLYENAEGTKVGLFEGIRVTENPGAEGGHPAGIERLDEEICSYDEFEIVE